MVLSFKCRSMNIRAHGCSYSMRRFECATVCNINATKLGTSRSAKLTGSQAHLNGCALGSIRELVSKNSHRELSRNDIRYQSLTTAHALPHNNSDNNNDNHHLPPVFPPFKSQPCHQPFVLKSSFESILESRGFSHGSAATKQKVLGTTCPLFQLFPLPWTRSPGPGQL